VGVMTQTPQVTAIVGNDVQLTCRASRYIYTHLGWFYPSSEPAPSHSVLRKMGKYSISVTLLIPNVTREQSGLYRCRAQNQHFPFLSPGRCSCSLRIQSDFHPHTHLHSSAVGKTQLHWECIRGELEL
uniref:Ig-like domain-containing protein n=1 Tax=Malurus cyaneus samueli TaxID=2593467 RepID=A0A8C5X9K0_9PASS